MKKTNKKEMSIWMKSAKISAMLNIKKDRRFGGKDFDKNDENRLNNIAEEWNSAIGPILPSLDGPSRAGLLVDMFFNDYSAAKERILDASAKKKAMYLEEMAAFGDAIKKIDKKL